MCNCGCGSVEAYCVKCKAKKTMDNAEKVTMKNGRPAAIKGQYPDCGTGMYEIVSKG